MGQSRHGASAKSVGNPRAFGVPIGDPCPLGITQQQIGFLILHGAQMLIDRIELIIGSLIVKLSALAHIGGGYSIFAIKRAPMLS